MTARPRTASPHYRTVLARCLAAYTILVLTACASLPAGPEPYPSDRAAMATQHCREALNRRLHAPALVECDAAVRARPASAAAWLDRSAAYIGLNRPAEAEADATQAIRLDPSNFGAYNNRGLSFLRRGQLARAIADFDQSLRLRPDHINALRNRGFAHRALGAYEDAVADFDRVVRLRPNWADGYAGRGITLARRGRPEAGLQDMEMAVRLAPASPEARNDRGWVRERAGLTELALADYAAALAMRPGFALANVNHDRLLARLHPVAETESPPAPLGGSVVPVRPSAPATLTAGGGVVPGGGRWVATDNDALVGVRSVAMTNLSPGEQCRTAIAAAERAHGIPPQLLAAIGHVESGRRDPATGVHGAWPWTINAEGQGYYFENKAVAIAAVDRLRARGGRSIDVGCMQVNLKHHPSAFASLDQAFDPSINADYAARFLVQLHDETGDWRKATANYHSANPAEGGPYADKVTSLWPEVQRKAGLAAGQGRSE